MARLRLEFKPISSSGTGALELHSEGHAPRPLDPAALQPLLAASQQLDKVPAASAPEAAHAMAALGRQLYQLLDGPERRLAGPLDQTAVNATIELAFPPDRTDLHHLPWELLHDTTDFLVRRGIIPVRILAGSSSSPPRPAANRPLHVLFMACSPRNVRPVLPFELEERIFLDATTRLEQPIRLTPEETGSVEELEHTIRDYGPGELDIFHLTGHGDLYSGKRHAGYPAAATKAPADGTPVLLTEDDAGFCLLATAADLESAFGERIPPLVFLSACRTGEAGESTPSSLAQALIARGFPAVLGWSRPVLDSSATLAATLLYRDLASGFTIEQALRSTLRELAQPDAQNNRPFRIPDWSLLRLFARSGGSHSAQLVTPKATPGRVPYVPPRRAEGFLDKDGREGKVAGDRFVGRRRPLQRTLPALKPGSKHTGVIVWGLGGLGKSSLAARLCDRVERRRPHCQRAVLVGLLDEDRLLALLKKKYARFPLAALTDPAIPSLEGRLGNFFDGINAKAPLLLVLDDFEENIELAPEAAAGFRLKPAASDTLAALCGAIAGTETRLIVTSRYWAAGAFPPGNGLLAEQLPQMDREEFRKKALELDLKNTPPERVEQLVDEAAGNPRMFDALAAGNQQSALAVLHGLKLRSLIQTLDAGERARLARLSVFHIPVVESLAREVTGAAAGGDGFTQALGLGLAERSESAERGGEPQLLVPSVVREALAGVLADEEWRAAYGYAARVAHRLWWQESEGVSEDRMTEMVRLATLGDEREIACDLAERLAIVWNNQARYRDTVRWLNLVLARFEDHRLLTSIAIAERVLGETTAALAHLDRARVLQPEGDDRERAVALHEQAGLRAQQGEVTGALELHRQSLEINERIGDAQGKAATLHAMAGLRAQQGEVAVALELYGQSLEIHERIGAAQGKAATLHEMAGLRAQQGEVAVALELYGQSLEIKERIGDAKGKAATLANMAYLSHRQNDPANALRYSTEAAQTLAGIRAWPNLITVLGNLSAFDAGERRSSWLAQAAWLAVVLRLPVPDSLLTLRVLFDALPAAHPLELPLAALAFLFFAHHGDEELRAKNREDAAELLGIAASDHQMSPDAIKDWLQQQAQDPARLFRETLTELEALAPGPWIYDRQAVLASLGAAAAAATAAATPGAPPDMRSSS